MRTTRIVTETPGREDKVLSDFCVEINFGVEKFGDYNSRHEAYAVILEEVDELWDALKTKNSDLVHIYSEALQVAATSYRLAEEIYIKNKELFGGS